MAAGDRDNYSGDLLFVAPTGGVTRGRIYLNSGKYVVARSTALAGATYIGGGGVIWATKATGTGKAFDLGEKVYVLSNVIDKEGGGAVLLGVALKAAAASDTEILVDIGRGVTVGVGIGTNVQAWDAALDSISALTTAADTMIYTSALDTYTTATLTAAGRALIDDADANTQRTTLGLAIGTDVQAYDAGLDSIAGLTTAADRMIYTTGADTYAVATLTAAGRALIDDADAATQRATLELPGAALNLPGPLHDRVVQDAAAGFVLDIEDSGKIINVTATGETFELPEAAFGLEYAIRASVSAINFRVDPNGAERLWGADLAGEAGKYRELTDTTGVAGDYLVLRAVAGGWVITHSRGIFTQEP